MISTIIVDDHDLFRTCVISFIENNCSDITITGEAESGEELLKLLPQKSADVILLDIKLPGMSGIEISRRLRNDYPNIKILIITSETTIEIIQELLVIGIDGFISKSAGRSSELPEAIRAIAAGQTYYGRDVAAIMYDIFVDKKNSTEPSDEFTDREREIILLCREGLPSKLIADRLKISPRTVETYKTRIFHKLGINSTMEMVQYALNKGIIRVNG